MNRKQLFFLWGLLGFCCTIHAAVTYPVVNVNNPNNPDDPLTGFGGLATSFKMGKYLVSITQYTEFLNAIAKTDTYNLYDSNMANNNNIAGISRTGSSGSYVYAVITNGGNSANRPITFINWFSAARFANWMANGQPTGSQTGPLSSTTTENGAYNLNGAVSGNTVVKNATNPNITPAKPPTFYLPNDNEWYKAAYYIISGKAYTLYATQSNLTPGNTIGGTANQANYIANQTGYCTTQSFITSLSINYLTDVGAFTASDSRYGTFDQTGSVWEWNTPTVASAYANLRGGSYLTIASPFLLSTYYQSTLPNQKLADVGFRLAAP